MLFRTVCATLVTASAFVAAPQAADAAAADKCPGALDTPTDASAADAADAVTCLVNAERSKRGLRPVSRDADLGQAARKHARDMVRRGYFSHVSPGGSTLGDRLRSAGYGRGQGWRAGEALGWAPGAWRRPTRWSTSGSTARRTAASCSTRATANWGSGSRPGSRGTTNRASRARPTRWTSGRSATDSRAMLGRIAASRGRGHGASARGCR